jgi:hypothetical protein
MDKNLVKDGGCAPPAPELPPVPPDPESVVVDSGGSPGSTVVDSRLLFLFPCRPIYLLQQSTLHLALHESGGLRERKKEWTLGVRGGVVQEPLIDRSNILPPTERVEVNWKRAFHPTQLTMPEDLQSTNSDIII